jgi:transposase-like protein
MRCIAIGSPSPELERISKTLIEIQDRQITAMVPGARASDVDAILRQGTIAAGIRDSYDNITGYTLGYYADQPLRLSDFTWTFHPDADWALEEGMVFHMYASAGGLAISESIYVGADGAERLTQIERKLFTAWAIGLTCAVGADVRQADADQARKAAEGSSLTGGVANAVEILWQRAGFKTLREVLPRIDLPHLDLTGGQQCREQYRHRLRRWWRTEEKLEIVMAVGVVGATMTQVAQRHEITRQQVYPWLRDRRLARMAAKGSIEPFIAPDANDSNGSIVLKKSGLTSMSEVARIVAIEVEATSSS